MEDFRKDDGKFSKLEIYERTETKITLRPGTKRKL